MDKSVTVTVRTDVNFKPFMTPNFVTRAGSGVAEYSIPLKEAGLEVLDKLVEHWINDVYTRADKRNPWMRKTYRG